jgi:error-prone DNA polymerase
VLLVARTLTDFSVELASVGEREAGFPLPHGRGDQVRNGGAGPDPRERPPREFRGRVFADPYGHIKEIAVKTRDFR